MNSAQDETATDPAAPAPSNRRLATLLPVLIFFALAGVFLFALQTGDPQRLPSVLVGKPVPAFDLAPVDELLRNEKPVPGFSNRDLAKGDVSIVNVWASWCIPCHEEHPYLVRLVELSGAPLYGINYKDRAPAARRFLGRYGNPFTAVGADDDGRVGIEWGVTGVPETFIIDGEGRVFAKHTGPMDARDVAEKLLPLIEKARKAE